MTTIDVTHLHKRYLDRIAELEAQLADRDKREGELVTDLADLYEQHNGLREALSKLAIQWEKERDFLGVPDDTGMAYGDCASALRALLSKTKE